MLLFSLILALGLFAQNESSIRGLKKLSDYPLRDRIWIGNYGAQVTVNPTSDLASTRQGEIQWLVKDGDFVKEGEDLVITAAKRLEISRKSLELDRDNVKKRINEIRWSYEDKQLALKKQIDELVIQLSQTELTTEERRLVGTKLLERLGEERVKLLEQKKRLEERLDPERFNRELENEIATIKLEFERKELEFKDQNENSRLTAEHDGRVKIEIKSGSVLPSDLLGGLVKQGFAEVSLQLIDPISRSIPVEELAILVHRPDGVLHPGEFERVEAIKGKKFGPLNLVFTLKEHEEEPVPVDLTGERTVTLVRTFDVPHVIISKSDFLFSYTAEIKELGWSRFISKIFPSAKVKYVGPKDLAVLLKGAEGGKK